MNTKPVQFVHFSDTHIGPSISSELYGVSTYARAKMIVQCLKHLPDKPHFIIHTGDITADPEEAAYSLAAEIFSELSVPMYYVVGNHDAAHLIRKYLKIGAREVLIEDEKFLSYRFSFEERIFVVLDATGPKEIDPHGLLPNEQLDAVRNLVRCTSAPLTFFVHYPVMPLDSCWHDNNMLLLNGGDFHRVLLDARERVRGVFFGHVHRSTKLVLDGILYSSAASTFCQFSAWTNDQSVKFYPEEAALFEVVSVFSDRTLTKTHGARINKSGELTYW